MNYNNINNNNNTAAWQSSISVVDVDSLKMKKSWDVDLSVN